jgi:hypothetical protein
MPLKVIKHRNGTKTFIYTVSELIREYAFKGAESVIRALAGSAIKDTDKIIIKHKKVKKSTKDV